MVEVSCLLSSLLIWTSGLIFIARKDKVVTSRMERRQVRELQEGMGLILLKQLMSAISCLEEKIKSKRNQRRIMREEMVRAEHHKTERSNVAGDDQFFHLLLFLDSSQLKSAQMQSPTVRA